MAPDPAEELALWRYHLIAEALNPRRRDRERGFIGPSSPSRGRPAAIALGSSSSSMTTPGCWSTADGTRWSGWAAVRITEDPGAG